MIFPDAISYDDVFYWQFWLIKDFYNDTEWDGCWNIVNGFSKMKWKRLIVDSPIHKAVQLDKDDKSLEVKELTMKLHSQLKYVVDELFDIIGPHKDTTDEERICEKLFDLLIHYSRGFCCSSHTITKLEDDIRYESRYRNVHVTGPAIIRACTTWYHANCSKNLPNADEANRWVEVPKGKEFLFDKAPDEEIFKSALLKGNLAEEIIQWDLTQLLA